MLAPLTCHECQGPKKVRVKLLLLACEPLNHLCEWRNEAYLIYYLIPIIMLCLSTLDYPVHSGVQRRDSVFSPSAQINPASFQIGRGDWKWKKKILSSTTAVGCI